MPCNLILIGGSSHTGKSTLAKALGERLGWPSCSTDTLARHPGRPWSRPDWEVPPHIAEYYRTSDMDFLLADVLRHYRRTIWPKVMEIVGPLLSPPHPAEDRHPLPLVCETQTRGERGEEVENRIARLVLEGSAVLPELVVTLPQERVKAVWLTCSEACFRERMYTESGYASRTAEERRLIDTFLARTISFDAWMMDEVRRLNLPWLDVTDGSDINLVYLTTRKLGLA